MKFLKNRKLKETTENLGRWAFAAGIILSTAIAFLPSISNSGYFISSLFILGIIVGYFNISDKNMSSFLIGVMTLIIVGTAGLQVSLTVEVMNINFRQIYDNIFVNWVVFSGAAGIVVAKKLIMASGSKPQISKNQNQNDVENIKNN